MGWGERERGGRKRKRERERRETQVSLALTLSVSSRTASILLPLPVLFLHAVFPVPPFCSHPFANFQLSLSCLVGSFPPLYRHCCRRVHIQGEVVDPYVVLALFGAPGDTKRERTRVVDDNGLSPVWQQSFEFPVHVRFFLLSPCVYRSVHPSFLNSMY